MLLNIYKPRGITSHDVVDEVRKIIRKKRSAETRIRPPKVGHAGTLDPFAEGVIVVGVGRESTKKLGNISKNSKKEYVATMELGKISDTGDIDGKIIRTKKHKNIKTIRMEKILETLKKFEGETEQMPPQYSAIKIKGKPAYKYAREGKKVEIPKRKVEIHDIKIYENDIYKLKSKIKTLKLGWQRPYLTIKAECSSGTYIRTLAEDIGKKLETGAYLTRLIRTRVGEYSIKDSAALKNVFDLFNE